MPFASTLCSISIQISRWIDGPRLQSYFWTQLMALTGLETIHFVEGRQPEQEMCTLLKEFSNLRHLYGIHLTASPAPLVRSLCTLSQLRSLSLKIPRDHTEPSTWHWLSSLSSLTWLSISVFYPVRIIALPTQESKHALSHALWFLSNMTNLESLSLGLWDDVKLPSLVLSCLPKLKSLAVDNLSLDKAFFMTLGSMPGLTELRLTDCAQLDSICFHGINNLKNLEKLYLCQPKPRNAWKYIDNGTLTRLKYFSLPDAHLSKADQLELHNKLPCLRRIR